VRNIWLINSQSEYYYKKIVYVMYIKFNVDL